MVRSRLHEQKTELEAKCESLKDALWFGLTLALEAATRAILRRQR